MEEIDICSGGSEILPQSEVSNTSVSSLNSYKTELSDLQNEGAASKNQSLLSDGIISPKVPYRCSTPFEKDKRYLYHIEKKIELKFNSQIECLLRNKAQLEIQLDSASKQITRLIDNFKTNNNSDNSSLKKRILQLEKDNLQIYKQNACLLNEVGELQSNQREREGALEHLNSNVNEYKNLVTVRDVCIEKLKAKISQQCVEMQKIAQSKTEMSYKIPSLENELQHCKKSESWYREQLRISQHHKKQLLDEISEQKKSLLSRMNEFNQLKLELNDLKDKYQENQLEMAKRHETVLQGTDLSKCTTLTNILPVTTLVRCSKSFHNDNNDTQQLCRQYQQTIKELTDEMKIIQNTVSQSQVTIQQRNKENSELTAQCIKLQKVLYSKENEVQNLENQLKKAATNLSDYSSSINTMNKGLLNAKAENNELKVQLSARNKEKEFIDITVVEIRDKFIKLKSNYEQLKKEINVKEKHIIQLETEKQELFMNNNWKICELEKIKNNDLIINELHERIRIIESEKLQLVKSKTDILEKYDEQRSMLEQELESLRILLSKTENTFTNEINNLSEIIANKEETITKYEKSISSYQSDIKNIEPEHTKDSSNLLSTHSIFSNANYTFVQSLASLLFDYFKSHLELEINIASIENIITNLLKDEVSEISPDLYKNSLCDSCKMCGKALSSCKFISMQGIHGNHISKVESNSANSASPDPDNWNNSHCSDNLGAPETLLGVETVEEKCIENRHETNNRTLLRKVKEHLQRRNAAERHSNQLQSLYSSLLCEKDALKIQLSSKEEEIGLLREHVDKLKLSLKGTPPQTVVGSDNVIHKVIMVEDVQALQIDIDNLKHESLLKNETIQQLELELQAAHLNEANASKEKNEFVNEVENKDNELKKLKKELVKIKSKFVAKEQQYKNLFAEHELLNNKFEQEYVKVEHLTEACQRFESDIECMKNEIEGMNRDLAQKCEQLKRVKKEKESLEQDLKEKQQIIQTSESSVTPDIEEDLADLKALRSEKFFLQRLCKDLQNALLTSNSQNAALKERLSKKSQEQQFSSLPNILPSLCVPSKLDEDYIKQLLVKSKTTTVHPLSDIQESLESLKKEVFTLRRQVEEETNKIGIQERSVSVEEAS